jgi:hypothetical protein
MEDFFIHTAVPIFLIAIMIGSVVLLGALIYAILKDIKN